MDELLVLAAVVTLVMFVVWKMVVDDDYPADTHDTWDNQ